MTRALQTLIHVGCKQLGLDSDQRRALQLVETGKGSMRDMSEADLRKVIARLERDGFEKTSHRSGKRPAAKRADVRYIHVLWRLLSEAGHTKVPGRKGLNALIRSQFEGKWQSVPIDVDALQDAGQINDVTRMLKAMCARHGISTERRR